MVKMTNKKAQVPPHVLIGGIALIIGIIIGVSIANNNCKDKLDQKDLIAEQLRGQISNLQTNLDDTNELVRNQSGQINNLTTELEKCQNSSKIYYKNFPLLFGLDYINITEGWAFVINLSLGISLFSLFKIVIKFGKNKK